jgi:hypothetical protein
MCVCIIGGVRGVSFGEIYSFPFLVGGWLHFIVIGICFHYSWFLSFSSLFQATICVIGEGVFL